ncbi:hypothetical protein [Bradyrhizobium sp. 2TAF24]|uniref:acyltransferase n=1 Tax=Bradyrhizobium sp. 2TAF24 TaxID=3233011 RepID=UPI003F9389F3
MIRFALQVIGLFLPWPLRRRLLQACLGHKLHPDARIGLSIVLADEVDIARGARLGHFTYVGRMDRLQMAADAYIGNFNWISGLSTRIDTPFFSGAKNRRSELVVGECSMIGHQHYIDCTDSITIGRYAGIAGARSQFLTHGVEIIRCRQTCAPIVIGDYTMIGSGSLITKGVILPECCIVAVGSVINHIRAEPYSLIAGNPAECTRKVPPTAKFFHREAAVIH